MLSAVIAIPNLEARLKLVNKADLGKLTLEVTKSAAESPTNLP